MDYGKMAVLVYKDGEAYQSRRVFDRYPKCSNSKCMYNWKMGKCVASSGMFPDLLPCKLKRSEIIDKYK